MTVAFQFSREGSPIGAMPSYALQPSDLGALIGCTATPSLTGIPYASVPKNPVISTTVRYVSVADGLDTNDGTTSTPGAPHGPWQTIAKVNASSLSAGTSVLFKRGEVWREQLKPTSSGSAGNPIVFDAYGTAAAPIIKGSVAAATTGDWTLISGNLWKSTTAFAPAAQATITVTIASPGVVTWTAHGQPNGQAVAFSTTGALPTGITAGVGYYIVSATTNTFQIALTPGGAAINMSGSQSGVHSVGANGYPHNNANDVGNLILVSGGVTHVGATSYTLMTGQTDENLVSQGQYYFNTSDWKVHVFSFGNPATTMTGLELAIDRVNAYFNNINYIIIQNVTLQYCAGSGLMFHKTTNMVARDMTIAWCGGGNDGGKNVRAGNGADVQLVGSNSLIERCLIQQCYDSGLTIQPLVYDQPISNVTFRNNVITNTTQGLFQIISSGAAISGVSIYNNTGYNIPSWSEWQRWGAGGTDESGEQFGLYHSDSGGSSMKNYNNFNNVYAGLGTSCSIRHPVPTTTWQGSGNMFLDYNLWSRADTTAPIVCLVPSGGNPLLTDWAAGDAPPQEVHGVVGVDPKFANQDAGNFSPAPGSPLLNAGTNLYGAGVVWDFYKRSRPATGPTTIGAIQANVVLLQTLPANLLAPAIRGLGQVGQVVTADLGVWVGGSISFAYQLLRDATPISGASGTTTDQAFVLNYTCVTADHGHNLFMKVTAANAAGSTMVTSTLPQFALYRSTLTGSDIRLAYSLPTQEINHANHSPLLPDGSRKIALTTYDTFATGTPPLYATEGQGSLNTEIRLLDPVTGAVPAVVPPNVLYQNAWPNWIQDGTGFIYTTTQGTSGGKQSIGKYIISPPTTSLFYDPGDISITSSFMNSNGDVVMAGTTDIGGGFFQGFLYVKPNGGARVQLTTTSITPITGKVLGDSAPSFSPDGTKVVCLRQLTPNVFNIVVITLGASFTNALEEVIAVPGSAIATDGIPRFSDGGNLIITYHVDAGDVATSGIYIMDAHGANRTKLNLLTQSRLSLVEFVPGTGSSPSSQIFWSAQLYPIFGAKPVNTAVPTISGTAQVGQTLTTTPGTWQNSPALTRQWKLAGVAIAGATGLTYVPVSGDVGSTITVDEKGTNDGGIVTVTSAATATVIS